jgi:hypothetical protein
MDSSIGAGSRPDPSGHRLRRLQALTVRLCSLVSFHTKAERVNAELREDERASTRQTFLTPNASYKPLPPMRPGERTDQRLVRPRLRRCPRISVVRRDDHLAPTVALPGHQDADVDRPTVELPILSRDLALRLHAALASRDWSSSTRFCSPSARNRTCMPSGDRSTPPPADGRFAPARPGRVRPTAATPGAGPLRHLDLCSELVASG